MVVSGGERSDRSSARVRVVLRACVHVCDRGRGHGQAERVALIGGHSINGRNVALITVRGREGEARGRRKLSPMRCGGIGRQWQRQWKGRGFAGGRAVGRLGHRFRRLSERPVSLMHS